MNLKYKVINAHADKVPMRLLNKLQTLRVHPRKINLGVACGWKTLGCEGVLTRIDKTLGVRGRQYGRVVGHHTLYGPPAGMQELLVSPEAAKDMVSLNKPHITF